MDHDLFAAFDDEEGLRRVAQLAGCAAPEIRRVAMDVLGAWAGKDALRVREHAGGVVVAAVLNDADPDVRRAAAETAHRLGLPLSPGAAPLA